MVVQEVFEVLYSPVKAFKKIVEKPNFKGVLLILVLVIFFTIVEQYVIASRLSLETRAPDNEDWTESVTFWTSNGLLSNDTDFKVGNYSVKSFVSNDTNIWMNINAIGPFDCSGDTGYKELFFWVKWTHENGVPSSNATLRLFSESESRYFELDLADLISNSSDEWSNATLKIGPESQSWNSTGSPDWKSVTGLEFRLAWTASANLTMKIDDLYFRKYVPLLEAGAFSLSTILSWMMGAAINFSMNWILWAGILLLTVKIFHEEGGPWTVFFVIIGYAFSVTVVYAIASAAVLSTLPALNLPLNADVASALIKERWYPHLATQLVFSYFPFAIHAWTAVLCAIAIRFLCKIEWKKAARIAAVTFLIRIALLFFLVGF